MAVASAGVIAPFANHTFQPMTPVRRVDLADTVSRLLSRVAPPADVERWQSSRVAFPDLASSHLAYEAASLAVASGVMAAEQPGGSFEPGRVVTGSEAVAAITRLQAMAELSSRR